MQAGQYNHKSLYRQAVSVCQEYLGPTGERFIRRQIMMHLGKKPESLTAHDLSQLTEWIRPTFGLLTDDQRLIDDFIDNLKTLANAKDKRGR